MSENKSNISKENISESKAAKSTKDKGLHEGHRERLRKRFREAESFDGFEEHQILELLLFYVIPRRDTNEMAHKLINRFGSLARVMDASYEELMEFSFINENAAVLLKFMPSLISVYHNSGSIGKIYDNSKKLEELFKPCFAGLNHEEFRVACFSPKLELLTNERICEGGPTESKVDIRKLMEIAIKSNAAFIAVAHNHPKGDPTPSTVDIRVTKCIKEAMNAVDITLIDHIIVGERKTFSMSNTVHMSFLN